MSNRCPDCQKFVGLEMAEPGVESIEISSFGEIDKETGKQELEFSGEVRLVLECAECSGEMKEVICSFDNVIIFEHEPGCKATEEDVEIEEDGIESTEDSRPPGAPSRFQKHFYGADVNIRIWCPKCENTMDTTAVVEEQASNFEEMF